MAAAVAQVDLTPPGEVGTVLRSLRRAGADDAVAELLARDPAVHTDPTNASAVTWLLRDLREAGAETQVRLLATRAAIHADLIDPEGLCRLLREFREAGAHEAVTMLVSRDPGAHTLLLDPDWGDLQPGIDAPPPDHVLELLSLLEEVSTPAAAATAAKLRTRAADSGRFPDDFAPYGRDPDGRPTPPWTWNDLDA